LIENPIDEELLEEMKKALVDGGRFYNSTMKWHAEPLAEKLRAEGFDVTMRPMTEEEAKVTPMLHNLYRAGEKHSMYYGPGSWMPYRLVAILRNKG